MNDNTSQRTRKTKYQRLSIILLFNNVTCSYPRDTYRPLEISIRRIM